MSTVVACDKCGAPIPAHYLNVDDFVDCPKCASALQVRVFPTLFHARAPEPVERLGSDTEASCYFHAENRAITACDTCGRFLCGVCRIDVSGQSVCASCIDAGIRTRKMTRFENRRTMYDTIALATAAIPAVMIWPSVITAPLAIFLSIRHWRSPSSIVRRTKVRFILAIVIALLQIALWVTVAILLIGRWPTR